PIEVRKKYDTTSLRKLLCSSAPVQRQMKLDIMECFPGVELYEGYGSTEAGIVTVLKPEDQMRKLGSIGFESLGTDFIKILDEDGNEVVQGETGELYSRGPMLFDEYYKLPDKTRESFQGEWFSAGDMAKVDKDGLYQLVDRKSNLIITGGEHVYPSEVEKVIASHPAVLESAVVGLPDRKWGERVTAVVIPRTGLDISKNEIIDFCRDKLPGFKRPRQVIFIPYDEMPRTGSGKILHRVLRERYGSGRENEK
ncbi:MAG: AMP-binding protein, partial [Thermoplasmata archaeon]|nr:AMP-binding protein [Thermoplasmata archaeon]